MTATQSLYAECLDRIADALWQPCRPSGDNLDCFGCDLATIAVGLVDAPLTVPLQRAIAALEIMRAHISYADDPVRQAFKMLAWQPIAVDLERNLGAIRDALRGLGR